jgi:hypothetical protein
MMGEYRPNFHLQHRAVERDSYTIPRNDMSQPQSSDWLTNSRGGTRTRDPGILSENAKPSGRNSTGDDAAQCGEARRPNDA